MTHRHPSSRTAGAESVAPEAVARGRSRLQVLTFVAADLAESSSVLASLGEGRRDTGSAAHLALWRNAIAAHRGRELHHCGDRALVAFDVPSDAVGCAVAVQRAAERHNKRGLDRLDIRIGIQFGEAAESMAVSETGDYLAPPAVQARQLCDAARGGQILVSDVVSYIARSEASHTFERAGLIEIDGAVDPWPTFEVILQGAPGERPPLPRELAARPTGRCSFIGRERERDELRRIWAAAADGERRLAFIMGEPGIGKSRLVAEFAAEAHSDGAVVLSGRSFEESIVPYQPFVEALRQYVADCDPIDLEAQLGGDPGALAALVPEIANRFPVGIAEGDANDRYRLFDGVAAFLSMISISSPVLLVLDDLQWADQATRLLLKHIALDPRPASILILGTHRDSEVEAAHPLNLLQADIERDHAIDRLTLAGFDDGEVATMFDEMIGWSPPVTVAEGLHTDTGGNPFFVQEVIAQLAETGVAADRERLSRGDFAFSELGVPTRVREFVSRRMQRISPRTLEALGVASIVGTEFGLEILAAVLSASVDDLVDDLDEAVSFRLVDEVPGKAGAYVFTHALFQQVLEEEHSNNRRATLHARVAEAIEAVQPNDPATLSDLARHYALTAGRYAEKVVHYGTLAGDRALAGLAYEDAIGEYSRALDALPLTASADEADRADLLVRLGEAHTRAGDAETAKRLFRDAAERCEGQRCASTLARAALGYGGTAGFGGVWETLGWVDDVVIDLVERALAICTGDDPTRVRLLGRLAQALYWSDEQERMLALSREALAIARTTDDPEALAHALDSRHVALWNPDHASELRSAAEEMLMIGKSLDDRDIQLKALAWLITDALETDPAEIVDGFIAEHARLAEELGQPYHLWYTAVTRGMRAHFDGRYDDMARLAQEGFELGQQCHGANAQQTFLLHMLMLNRELGRVGDVVDGLAAYAAQSPLPAWRAALANAYAVLGRHDEATNELTAIANDGLSGIPMDCVWMGTLGELSQAAARLGAVEHALSLYPLLLPHAERMCVVGGGVVCLGPVSWFLGLLAATIGDIDGAIAHFEDALERSRSHDSPPNEARAKIELARALLAPGLGGDRARALVLLHQARETAEGLGMEGLVGEADRILLSASTETTAEDAG